MNLFTLLCIALLTGFLFAAMRVFAAWGSFVSNGPDNYHR